MAIPFTPQDVASGFNLTKLNQNFDDTQTALQDALSRSGQGPNQMEADIDLNSNDLLNVNQTKTNELFINGALVTPDALQTIPPSVMLKGVYDPQLKNTDAFARGNHTGEQAIGTVTGLQAVLDDKVSKASTADQALGGKLTAPYLLPTYRGLKISEFLTNNDDFTTPKTASLQAAIDILVSNSRYTGLDLEGRLIVIDAPLNFGTSNLFFPQKQIYNGFIYAANTFTLGDYMFDLSGNPDMRNFHFDNVYFHGNSRAGWFRMPQKYKGIRFNMCQFIAPRGDGEGLGEPASRYFGVYDPMTPAGGNHELQFDTCFFDSAQSGTASSSRDRVAIFTNSPDMMFSNCIAQYFETWLYATSGSYQLIGNHVYADSDGTTANKMVHFTNAVQALGVIFTGNYVDGVECRFTNQANTAARIGGFSFSGNLFLATPNIPSGFAFVRVAPHAANTGLTGVTMQGNVYDNNGSVLFVNIAADTTSGTINADDIQRVLLDDPGIDVSKTGRVYKSRPRFNHLIAAESTQAFSFTNDIPAFSKIKRTFASFERATSGDAMAYAVPRVTGTATATVDLSASSNGRLELYVDINSDSYATS